MKKLMALVLVLVLALGLLAGCSSGDDESGSTTNPPAQSAGNSGNSGNAGEPSGSGDEADEPGDVEVTYPLTDGATFTCWWPNDLTLVGVVDYNDTPIFQYLEQKTGVHLDFQNPTGEGAGESYSLMLAGDDLTDFVRQIYLYHSRGFDEAIDSGWYLNQMDYMQYTPNLERRLYENPEVTIQALTDSGYLCGFPMIMSEATPWVNGMMIRTDWLDDLGLSVPKTIADVEDVLVAFKDNIDTVDGGLYMNNKCFTGLERSFDMVSDFGTDGYAQFMQKDGVVYAGVLSDGYRDYITTLADWYAKGLISPDFVNQTSYISIGNGSARLGGEFGLSFDCFVYMDSQNVEGQKTDPDYNFAPIPFPTKDASSTVHTLPGHRLVWQGALGISTKCENVELACRYWDYLYSDEGSQYANFGEEGVTMEWGDDGLPHLNEFAKHNPQENMNLNQVENYYMLLDGPFYRIGYREYEAISDNERTCGDMWTIGDDAYTMPDNITLSEAEGNTKANIMSEINTYVEETQARFVTGERPLSEFDDFIAQVKSMGIDDVTAIYQAALDRYNARG